MNLDFMKTMKTFENYTEKSEDIFDYIHNLREIKNYIDESGDLNVRNEHGETALIRLSEHLSDDDADFYEEVIILLMENGADLDLQDDWGVNLFSNLIYKSDNLKLIKKSINLGINTNAEDNSSENNNPLMSLIMNIDSISQDYKKAELIINSKTFDLDNEIRKNKINMNNDVDTEEWSFLLSCSVYERYDIMKLLFDKGLELNAVILSHSPNPSFLIKKIPNEYKKYLKKEKVKDFNL